jgi:hypothetical protein
MSISLTDIQEIVKRRLDGEVSPLFSAMTSYSWGAKWQNLTWWDERFPNFDYLGTDE